MSRVQSAEGEGEQSALNAPNAQEGHNFEDIQPVGVGAFGNIYDQFRGRPQEAVQFLLERQEGEAVGALYHPEVGEIDIVWGKEGTAQSDGFGLSKLVKFHPEVVDKLQEVLNDMTVVKRTDNRVQLESEKYQASVRLTWDDTKKTWLLTMFEKRDSAHSNSTGTAMTTVGNENGTANLEDAVSFTDKVNENFVSGQEAGIESGLSALERVPKDERGEPVYEQADVDTAWDALLEQTEGDVEMAQAVADEMVADKRKELQRLEKAKVKSGSSVAEKIQAQRERKMAIEQAQREVAHWEQIAMRQQEREAEEAVARAEEARIEAERLAKEEAELVAQNGLQGVPDMADDRPVDARQRGFRRMAGHRYDRQGEVAHVAGKPVSVKFADGVMADGRVAVVEASQLQPSHMEGRRNPLYFIDEAQPKERNDEASVASARKIASNIRPEEITSSVTAYTGAPTVNSRGEVIQGNNRGAALRQMWANFPEQGAKYKQYLMDNAEAFGLTAEEVEAMEAPVLVNMADVSDVEAIELGQYVATDTESGGVERIKGRQTALKLGDKMGRFAELLLNSNDGEASINEAIDKNGHRVLHWLNDGGFITPTQYQSAFDRKGNLTAEVKNDLKAVLGHNIFSGGHSQLEEVFGTLPAKAQRALLATAYRDFNSPESERMMGEIQASIMAYNELSTYKDFAQARTIEEANSASWAWSSQAYMDDVTGETYLPSDKYSNFALKLAVMYKGERQATIQSVFNTMYDIIQGAQQDTLFETADKTPRTLAEAIKEILNIDYDGQNGSHVLGSRVEASQGRSDGSAGVAGVGEQTSQGEGHAERGGSVDGDSSAVGVEAGVSGSEVSDGSGGEQSVVTGESAGMSDADALAEAERETDINPSEAQKVAGNYKKGHVRLAGFDISIEQPKGSVRRGVDANGKAWETTMNNTYGYIRGTKSVDGDALDVFLGDISSWDYYSVFVVDQYNEDGTFDEHKVMFGFNSKDEAYSSYLANYEAGWDSTHRIDISSVSLDEFKRWVDSSKRKTKAFSLYRGMDGRQEVTDSPTLSDEAPLSLADLFDADATQAPQQAEEDLLAQAERANTGKRTGKNTRKRTENKEQGLEASDASEAVSETEVKNPSGNKLVTDERYEVLKNRMRILLGGHMNMGVNPEVLAVGTEMAVYHIEKGAKRFADYAKAMIADLGEGIRPYLKAFYNGARELPEVESIGLSGEMTPYDEVRVFDVANFDSSEINAMATAEQVVAEQVVEKQAQEGKQKLLQERKKKRERRNKQSSVEASKAVQEEGADAVKIETTPSGDTIERRRIAGFDVNIITPNANALRDIDAGLADGKKEAKESEQEIIGNRKTESKKEDEQAGENTEATASQAEAVAGEAESLIEEATTEAEVSEAEQKVDEQLDAIDEELAQFNIDDLQPYMRAILKDGRNVLISTIVHSGEQRSATQMSKPRVESLYSTYKGQLINFSPEDVDIEATRRLLSETRRLISKSRVVPVEAEPKQEPLKKPKGRKKKAEALAQSNELDLFDSLFDNETSNGNALQGADKERSEDVPANGKRHEQGSSRGPETSVESTQEASAPKNLRNFRSEAGQDPAPTGVDARINANLEAIELMQALMDSGDTATPEQMRVLSRFSGWGGLGKAFNRNDAFDKNSPYSRLKALLSPEAYDDAVMSANTGYYTPAYVADALWGIAERMGFRGGVVLEGSAGTGNLLAQMPAPLSERSAIQAVEKDSTTGNILSLLYPDAHVDVQGFEETKIANGSVDLAITNVPFVTGLRVNDTTGDKDLSVKFRDIHDFCIAKNVRKLREGGIGIFITTSGTLDGSKKLRDWVVGDGNADFVGAFRLNNSTFIGTGVTADIIVIRKRVGGKVSAGAIDVSTTVGVREADYTRVEYQKGNVESVTSSHVLSYNGYFARHPERMGGVMEFGFEHNDTYRPTSVGVYAKGINQAERLAEFVSSFVAEDAGVAPSEAVTENNSDGSVIVSDRKVGEVFVRDGVLYINSATGATPLPVNANKVKGKSKAECYEAYDAIKQALSSALDYQTEHADDKGLKPLLERLNASYDSFVGTYGHFHGNPAIAFLRHDVDFANIAALERAHEVADGQGNKRTEYVKSDVFDGRVVTREVSPAPQSAKEGLVVSMSQFGRVDVPYIAEKLGRDASDVRSELLSSGHAFENPVSRELEPSYVYLSGYVREKLQQAIDNNEEGAYDANISALRAVVPADIPAHLIEFTLGSSWIDAKHYEDFIFERTDIRVSLHHVGGTWRMTTSGYANWGKNIEAGIRLSNSNAKVVLGHELIEKALQNRTVSVTYKDADGNTVTDAEVTSACMAKIEEYRQEFKDWMRERMQNSPELTAEMERVYNDAFNSYVPLSIPDEFVPTHFPGASTLFTLRPHQARAVLRAVTQPLMLAHEVGTGKTFTLITTAMEMRRLGTARKPMIVVQNATVGQFASSAKALYPNAKVLTLEDTDRDADGRKLFNAKVRYNDWDMIIVPQSSFERIPDSPERQMAYIKDKIDEKRAVLERMKSVDPSEKDAMYRQSLRDVAKLEDEYNALSAESSKSISAKDLKRRAVAMENAKIKATEMLERDVDEVADFDALGIDALLVDEAHAYKHLGFATAMTRGVKGIDPSYSKKSQGVYLKAQAVLEKSRGRNVVFATGTPISNTAAEVWTFMRYLMPDDVMRAYDIYYFDDFVRNFGSIQQMLEFGANGKFREATRFSGYVNVQELVRLWLSVADVVRTSEAEGVNDKIPAMEDGKATDIFLPQTRGLRSVMLAVKSELERFEKMSGAEKRENTHIPLTQFGIAKAAAIDPRLVHAQAPDDVNSKTNEAVRHTLRSLEETSAYNGTVAIFSDQYQNNATGFNLYEDIRSKLIAQGVPSEQIVVMKSGLSDKKKLGIFDKVNRGEVRVILGSTFTLGTGVNVQERLHTAIHMDAPVRPMDYTQRNGRILRQGNLHKSMDKPVRVLRFGVEDSLDVTAYQRLKTKQAIVDSVMNGKALLASVGASRTIEEEEDVFGDVVAQLSGSEYAMLKNQAERQVRKLESRKKQWEADQVYIHKVKPVQRERIEDVRGKLQGFSEALAVVRERFPEGRADGIVVGKQRFDGVDAMGDFIKSFNKRVHEAMERAKTHADQTFNSSLTLSVGGLDFEVKTSVNTALERGAGATLFNKAERKMTLSQAELGLSDIPVKQGLLRNAIESIVGEIITGDFFERNLSKYSDILRSAESELDALLARDGKPFEFGEELAQAKEQLMNYESLMKKDLEAKEAKYQALDAELDVATDLTMSASNEDTTNDRYRMGGEEASSTYDPTMEFVEELHMERLERSEAKALGAVNDAFNEQLAGLTAENANDVVLSLGMPSAVLQSAGVEDKPMRLYGNKIIKKAGKHGFNPNELRNLPEAVANPIAVFDGNRPNSSVILTELKIGDNNVLTILQVGKGGADVDFNIVTSAYGKTKDGVVSWINKGLLRYANKEKALDYLYFPAPIAAASNSQELISATKVVENFENPSVGVEKSADSDVIFSSTSEKVGAVKALAERLNLGNVHVVTSLSGLQGKRKRAKGYYDVRTGEITIVAPNHTDVADIEKTLLHEAVAHHGLRELFGKDFDAFLDSVYAEGAEEVRREVVELAKRHNWDFRTATEEYLAGMAEDMNFEQGVERGLWDKVKALFVDLLRKAGFSVSKFNDNELRYVLWQSYQNLTGDGKGVLGEASRIAKAEALGVGHTAQAREVDTLYREGEPRNREEAMARAAYEKRVASGWYQAKEAVVDSMEGLKVAMEEVLKAEGDGKVDMADVAGFENAYIGQNRLSSTNEAERELFRHKYVNPLNKVLAKLSGNDVEYQALVDYMMAKHGLERNAVMHKKAEAEAGKELAKRDYAGLTALTGLEEVAEAEAEALRMVEEYEAEHDVAELWGLINALNKATLEKSYKSGILSQESYEAISGMYEHYVPLRGFDDKTSAELYAYIKERNGAFNAPIKTAKGRKSKADDPIAQMVSMADSAILEGNRNQLIKQRFLNFALNHPSDLYSVSDVWVAYDDVAGEWRSVFADNITEQDSPEEVEEKIATFEERMQGLAELYPEKYVRGDDALNIPYRVVNNGDLRQHQVLVKRGGREYVITVNGNPRLAHALNGLTNPDNSGDAIYKGFLRGIEKGNRWLSKVYTQLNPDFVLRNVFRDAHWANTVAVAKEGREYGLRYNKNWAKYNSAVMLGYLLRDVHLGNVRNADEQAFYEFYKNGGETGYAILSDIETYKRELQAGLERERHRGGLDAKRLAKRFTKAGLDYITLINRCGELTSRFAAFKTSRDEGRSVDRAIYDAKEITVNFSRKGSGGRFLGAHGQTVLGNLASVFSAIGRTGYIFFNAGVQGLRNIAKNTKANPGAMAGFFAVNFGLGLLQALGASLLLGDDDDEDKNSYFNIPEHKRRSNFMIGLGDVSLSIPVAREFSPFFALGELAGSWMSGKYDGTLADAMSEMAGSFSSWLPLDFMQLSNEAGLSKFIPSIAKPISEAMENVDWLGRPIYKDTDYNAHLPEYTKAYSRTNGALVGLSKWVNEFTGGDAYTKGGIDKINNNPAVQEHLGKSYLGGIWSFFGDLANLGEAMFGEREFNVRDVPMFGGVLHQGDDTAPYAHVKKKYYDYSEQAKKIGARVRGYDKDAGDGDEAAEQKYNDLMETKEFVIYEIISEYRGAIADLRREKREAVDEKEIKEIDRDLNELMQEAVMAIEEEVKGLGRDKKLEQAK